VLMHRAEPALDTEPPVGAVPRNLLRDAVFSRLLSSILRGEYRRGQRLRLDTIATDMRVSRTPVREALVPLETLRLVHVQRYVGVIIANWGVENMVERLRIIQNMLDVPADAIAQGQSGDRFDPSWVRDCLSEVGVFCVVAEWLLRRLARPVSADWIVSQRPALDMFYTSGVAQVHGIDMSVGAGERAELLMSMQAGAVEGDLRRVLLALDAFADGIAEVQLRFRPSPR